jgi:hypothetical protein
MLAIKTRGAEYRVYADFMVRRADTRGYLFSGGRSDRLFRDFQRDSHTRETRSARNFSPREARPMRSDSAAPCLKDGWRGAVTHAGARRRADGLPARTILG